MFLTCLNNWPWQYALKGGNMKVVIKMSLIILSPVMVVVYLRNSFRNVDNLHVNYDLKYAE